MLAETLNQNVAVFNGNLNLYENYMDNLMWNDSLRQALGQDYTSNIERYLAYRDVIDPLILNMKNMDSTIKRITIYSTNDTLYAHGQNFLPMDLIKINLNDVKDYRLHWYVDPKERKIDMYQNMYMRNQGQQNVVNIELDYNKVFANMTMLYSDDYAVVIKDMDGKIKFSFSLGQNFDELESSFINSEKKVLSSKNYVVKEATLEPIEWKVSLYRPLDIIVDSAKSITVLVVLVVIFCFCIIFIGSMVLTKSVVSPVNELVKNINTIEIDYMSVDVYNESEDEIGHLFKSFKRMVERLDCMINEVYQSKILQQEYEMKALQAQINPHFLYNSLSLINWKAIMSDQKEISEMAQLLSVFYRTTLNKGKNITTVKGEWDNTCSYIKIQKMMHSGKFETHVSIEEEILEYEMLNLLLQPLVENAIVHGLDHKQTEGVKSLWVTGKAEQDTLVFTVYDNGCGMTEDIIKNILTIETKGYGVQNVYHRIQLYYGEMYGLHYESKIDEGTKVTLTIPKVKKNNM